MKSVYIIKTTHYYGDDNDKEEIVNPFVYQTSDKAHKAFNSLMSMYEKKLGYKVIAYTGKTAKLAKEVSGREWKTYITKYEFEV